MDAHLFRLFWRNAAPFLTGARTGKIQEPHPGLITIDLFNFGMKRQLCWRFGKQNPFCYLAEERLASGRAPSGLIMRIRKYFGGRHIASVITQFCQRKLWLLAGAPQNGEQEKAAWLCLDLAHGPTLHFLAADAAPEEEMPDWPSPDLLADALSNWRNWPVLTPALRKELRKLPVEDGWALLEDLRIGGGCLFLQMKKDDVKSGIISTSAWPLGGDEEVICEEARGDGNMLSAFARAGRALTIERIYDQKQDQLAAPLRKKAQRLEKLLQKLDDDEKRLKAMLAREQDAQAIAAILWQIDGSAHLSALEFPSESGAGKIELDKRLSVLENMEKFFHNAKRGKRGLAMLAKRRAETEAEIASIKGGNSSENPPAREQRRPATQSPAKLGLLAVQQNLPKNVQASLSSDGYVLLCGRDAKGNNAARRLASPHDLWVHVENGPGAHVIIRRPHAAHSIPEKTLDEAGALAARKSWLKDAPSASVMYAEARHVHPDRKGTPGKVLIDRLAMTRTVSLVETDGR